MKKRLGTQMKRTLCRAWLGRYSKGYAWTPNSADARTRAAALARKGLARRGSGGRYTLTKKALKQAPYICWKGGRAWP